MNRSIEVRPGHYHDSVTLMQVSQALADDPAVAHAQVAMGTTLNLDLLVDAGYTVPPEATAGDLVIAIHLTDEAVAGEHVDATIAGLGARVDELLARAGRSLGGSGAGGSGADDAPPRSITSAAAAASRGGADATVALISVPGPHAARAALEAIGAGLHPIVFSDNVPVAQEIAIKRAANAAGLLAMGPDCGTVILDGVGLGFANAVVPGPIGLVSASGTGAQQVCALADQAGVGVRHVVGLGGRDLDDEVGGLSAIPALQLLDADPAVEVIGIVAKSIGPATTVRLNDTRRGLANTPTVLITVDDLTAATADLLRVVGVHPAPAPGHWPAASPRRPRPGRVVGLYSGGTLSAEAELVLAAAGLAADQVDVTDLGDDEFTRGRPHPMIDDRLRLDRLTEAIADPSTGAVLLDVVLGHGCLADPAAGLAPLIASTDLPVHVALVGTAGDPQGRDAQAAALTAAGAEVWLSNADAARATAAAVGDAVDGDVDGDVDRDVDRDEEDR
ncbi:MAG: FdrA family protein [Actinomycetota bacterium]